jgi:phage terminase small subunit
MPRSKRIITRADAGRISAIRDLGEKQKVFVTTYVENGGRAGDAARAAGYGARYGTTLLRNERVRAAIHAEQARILGARLASVALGALRAILEDPEAPAKVRLDAAKTVLDRAEHVAGGQAAPKAEGGKSLHEMSIDELEAHAKRLREALDRSKLPILEAQVVDVAGEG